VPLFTSGGLCLKNLVLLTFLGIAPLGVKCRRPTRVRHFLPIVVLLFLTYLPTHRNTAYLHIRRSNANTRTMNLLQVQVDPSGIRSRDFRNAPSFYTTTTTTTKVKISVTLHKKLQGHCTKLQSALCTSVAASTLHYRSSIWITNCVSIVCKEWTDGIEMSCKLIRWWMRAN